MPSSEPCSTSQSRERCSVHAKHSSNSVGTNSCSNAEPAISPRWEASSSAVDAAAPCILWSARLCVADGCACEECIATKRLTGV